MSCRTTPAGSLATTFVTRQHDLHDAQSTSLFHTLRRQYNELSEHPLVGEQYLEQSTENLYSLAIDEIERTVQNGERWTAGSFKARTLQRIAATRAAGYPEDRSIAYALSRMERAATMANEVMSAIFAGHASRLGVSTGAMKAEFNRIYSTYRIAQQDPISGFFDRTYDGLPKDGATRYALGVIERSARCSDCGQFLGATAHVCPPVGNRPLAPHPENEDGLETAQDIARQPSLSEMLAEVMRNPQIISEDEDDDEEDDNDPRDFVHGCVICGYDACEHTLPHLTQTQPPSSDQPIPTPTWVGHVSPVSMDSFQTEYDAARERIEAGHHTIPTIDYTIPGSVTGGLGSRGTGLPFGIEIELDFPDEDWPYEMRYLLARRLFEEGVTQNPYVNGWHDVGDGDRPSGGYFESPNAWNCEFDRSVDDCDGERGVEVKSQILWDEPATWENLKKLCDIANELGARATVRTGLHVNVGGQKFDSEDPTVHTSLLRLAGAYDDTIIRLAHNPRSSTHHRGRSYCGYADVPTTGFRSVADARARSNHYQAFNLGHLPAAGERMRNSSRVEVRLWDSTTDFGRIQAAVGISLAMVHLATEKQAPGQQMERAGTHKEIFGTQKLQGEEWERSTESFRRFMSLMEKAGLNSPSHRTALTQLFAESRWPNG